MEFTRVRPVQARLAARDRAHIPVRYFETSRNALESDAQETLEGPGLAKWVDSRFSNVVYFFIVGLAAAILPYLIFGQFAQIDLNCPYPQREQDGPSVDSPDREECENFGQHVQHSIFMSMYVVPETCFYYLATMIIRDPEGTTKSLQFAPVIALLGFFGCFLPTTYILFVVGVQIGTALITAPLEHGKKINKGGFYLTIFLLGQFLLSISLIFYVQPYLNNDFILGFRFTILIPIAIQINQGLGIIVDERLSPICRLHPINLPHIIFTLKYQMTFLNTLKIVALLQVLKVEENPFPTLVLNIIPEMFGRNQIWRISYRKFKKFILGRRTDYPKLSFLSQTALCSELDMDYFPMMIVILMNVFDSPLLNSMFSYRHITGTDLNLMEDSILSQSWGNIAILVTTIILGDVMTYVLGLFIRKHRVYDMEYVFMESRKWSIVYGFALTGSCIGIMCAAGYLFSEH